MAEIVLGFLVNQLSTLLNQEYSHVGGLQRELQYIKDELGSMRAFLREAEAKEEGDVDSELQEWVRQVREVAYDTQDVLDEFVLRFAHDHRARGIYGGLQKIYTTMKTLRARHQILTRIKDIKYRVESVSVRHQRYKSEYGAFTERESITVSGENARDDVRRRALLLEEADLVGIHKPKNELISQILDGDSHLKVVSVVGMGGLGKTTLVKRVYDDGNVKRRFSVHVWISVSQRFHLKEFFKDLVQQLFKEIREQVPPEVQSMDGDELRALVKDFLKEKIFIIVLDDVWSLESWDAIKCALPDANRGSRVVLTTRISDIAFSSCREFPGHVHKMKPLSLEESWTLFCKKTFEDKYCPPHLEDVSRNILKRCEGLPLAIVSISGLLALKDKSNIDEWEMVRRSLGVELEGTGKLDKVKKILLLSYNHLPYYLKICLLYMSIYPEDFTIWGWDLVRLWIAEGFVGEKQGMTLQEVAEGYLNELVNRSLVQVATRSVYGARLYSIHDLLREIILSKSKEHNITTVPVQRYTKWPDHVRRLVIHGHIDIPQEKFGSKHLQSLLIFGYTNFRSSSCLSKLLSSRPKLLKVLDLRELGLKNIPSEIFKLLHIKYLNLRCNQVEVIPKSIGKLQNLEYLNLINTKVKELPVALLKLGKLRELYVYQTGNYSENFEVNGFKAPNGIGVLVSLEHLEYIEADDEKIVREIGKLTQLRTLGITKLRSQDGKELCSSLEKLTNLRRLHVQSIRRDEIIDLQLSMSTSPRFLKLLELAGPLEKLPKWVPSLQALTELYLHGSRLMEDPLESLQHLPNLGRLVLYDAYEGETLCFKAGGFQKLESLELVQLKRLRWVTAEEGTMPHLHELFMNNCKSVEELPQGIQNLTKLQTLGFNDISNELITKLQTMRNHIRVPEIFIANWISGKWRKHYL